MAVSKPEPAALPRSWNWLITALAVAIVVVLSPNTFSFLVQLATGLRLPFGQAAAGLVFLLAGVYFIRFGFPRETLLYAGLLGLMLAYFCLSSFWSPSTGYVTQKALFTATLFPTLFAAGLVLGRDRGNFLRLAQALAALGLVITVIGLAGGTEALVSEPGFRDESVQSGYQSLSRMLGLAICAVIVIADQNGGPRLRLIAAAAGLAFAYVMLQTGGRTGLAVICAFFPSFLYFRAGPAGKAAIIIVAIAAILLLLTVPVDTLATQYATDERVPATLRRLLFYLSPLSELHALEESRTYLQAVAWDIFKANPWFGVGWAGFAVTAGYGDVDHIYPHNVIYEVAAETGLAGLLLLILLIGSIVRLGLLSRGEPAVKGAVLGFLCVGFVISLIVSDFSTQRELALFLGTALGLFATQGDKPTSRPKVRAASWPPPGALIGPAGSSSGSTGRAGG